MKSCDFSAKEDLNYESNLQFLNCEENIWWDVKLGNGRYKRLLLCLPNLKKVRFNGEMHLRNYILTNIGTWCPQLEEVTIISMSIMIISQVWVSLNVNNFPLITDCSRYSEFGIEKMLSMLQKLRSFTFEKTLTPMYIFPESMRAITSNVQCMTLKNCKGPYKAFFEQLALFPNLQSLTYSEWFPEDELLNLHHIVQLWKDCPKLNECVFKGKHW